jgi:hypothetical protein
LAPEQEVTPEDFEPEPWAEVPVPGTSAEGEVPGTSAEAPASEGASAGEAEGSGVEPRILRKIKLLEAVAELLIEKGLVTQDEIRDHLRKKSRED